MCPRHPEPDAVTLDCSITEHGSVAGLGAQRAGTVSPPVRSHWNRKNVHPMCDRDRRPAGTRTRKRVRRREPLLTMDHRHEKSSNPTGVAAFLVPVTVPVGLRAAASDGWPPDVPAGTVSPPVRSRAGNVKTRKPQRGLRVFGAGDRDRTGTMFPSADFKSAASANFATPTCELY